MSGRQEKKTSRTKRQLKTAKKAIKTVKALVDGDQTSVDKDLIQSMSMLPGDNLFAQAAEEEGFSPLKVVQMVKDLCYQDAIKIDKNGNVHKILDGKLRLVALEMLSKLAGWEKKSSKTPDGGVHFHQHLEKLSDGDLQSLETAADQSRETKKKS